MTGLQTFRERRAASLVEPHGWWSITCLEWLEEGENTVGSAETSTVRLAGRFPATAARVLVRGESATIVPVPGADTHVDDETLTQPVTVQADIAFTVQGPDPVLVSVVRRGDLWGVRVHDPVAARRRSVQHDLAWFDPAPEWVVEAEFLRADPGEEVPVSNVIGQVSMQPVAGRVRFEFGGASHTLLATEAGGGRLFINFRDASNEDLDAAQGAYQEQPVSYSGGRFLMADAPVNGRVILDFNRATHPPCGHTPYATCPIPTPGNRLPFAVTAGERVARLKQP